LALCVLSVPRQDPAAGVTVYCHVPIGAVSTQLVAETTPLQLAPVVWRLPSASYRLIT
jgi:hypothetical protein